MPKESSPENEGDKQDEQKDNPRLLSLIGSVLSSFIGVQDAKTRERDFKKGDYKVFIAIGIIAAFCLVMILITIVQVIISINQPG